MELIVMNFFFEDLIVNVMIYFLWIWYNMMI